MKRVVIHHEGGVAGPFGADAGDRMAAWRQAEQNLERYLVRGDDELVVAFFRGMAALALVRTLDGRQN